MEAGESDIIVGCTDGFRLGYVEGWAWRPNRPQEPVTVQMLVDGALAAEATACAPRPDLHTAGIGNGNYAFAIPLAIGPDAPPLLRITVRAKDGPVLPGGELEIATSPEERAALERRRSMAYLEQVFGAFTATATSAGRVPVSPPAPRLNFILYAATGTAALAGTLGMPDYSYAFVMRGFRQMLRRLGTVHVVRDPLLEVDPIYAACAARDESCLFLSFTPPQSTTLGLRCPTVPVIAWEFGTIPTGGWSDDARQDWRLVLRQTGRAITISDFAARAIRATMGASYPVISVPTPVWDRQTALRAESAGSVPRPPDSATTLSLDGIVWDSRSYRPPPDDRPPPLPHMPPRTPVTVLPMRGAQLTLAQASAAALAESRAMAEAARARDIAEDGARVLAAEVAAAEAAATPEPEAAETLAPRRHPVRALAGRVMRKIIQPTAGMLPDNPVVAAPANTPPMTPAPEPPIPEAAPAARAAPPRYALAPEADPLAEPALAMFDPDPYPPAPLPAPPGPCVTIDGIVFTAVLSPKDGRKNWQDILTAFTSALRAEPRATLVFKMIGADPSFWWWEFNGIIRMLPPCACRVVVLSGFLDDTAYQALTGATHFVVNASLAEGQCLPLVEFMSASRPAIAPRHTAMLDYITEDNALIVASDVEFCAWPHDPRNRLTTSRHRIEWPSLRDAFATAFRIVQTDTALYGRMAEASARSMRAYCADEVLGPRLADFLGLGDAAVTRAGWATIPRPATERLLESMPDQPT